MSAPTSTRGNGRQSSVRGDPVPDAAVVEFPAAADGLAAHSEGPEKRLWAAEEDEGCPCAGAWRWWLGQLRLWQAALPTPCLVFILQLLHTWLNGTLGVRSMSARPSTRGRGRQSVRGDPDAAAVDCPVAADGPAAHSEEPERRGVDMKHCGASGPTRGATGEGGAADDDDAASDAAGGGIRDGGAAAASGGISGAADGRALGGAAHGATEPSSAEGAGGGGISALPTSWEA